MNVNERRSLLKKNKGLNVKRCDEEVQTYINYFNFPAAVATRRPAGYGDRKRLFNHDSEPPSTLNWEDYFTVDVTVR